MRVALFILAIAMMITWLIGLIFFKPGMPIHALAIAGPLCWIQGIIWCPRNNRGKVSLQS